ncbi:MAG: heme-binding domain-containing protein [Desulfuromonadaceae bacterium]
MNLKKTLLVLIALAVAIQLVPIRRSNPPVTAEISGPPELLSVLRRVCYDCHSNETVWPWYSRVAPASWLVTRDVNEGRGHLNFSHWGDYPAGKQHKLRQEIWEEVEEDAMPPLQYRPFHPEASLDERDKNLIRNWSESSGTALGIIF